MSYPLYPYAFSYSSSITNNSITYPIYSCPIMQYVGNGFGLYRGSITLTFKVVKTEFHSGRLLIAFFPGKNNSISPKNTFANTQYVYREVIDLRTSSEVSITFPFTSLTPYLSTSDSYGTASVFVLNPLVATSNVSQSVDILVEAAAGPDLEFAYPINLRYTPVIVNPQCGIELFRFKRRVECEELPRYYARSPPAPIDKPMTNIFVPQSGISATSKPIVSVMDNSTVSPVMEPAMYCIGERIQSVRQLIKRFSTWYSVTAATRPTMQIGAQYNYLPILSTSYGIYNNAGQNIDLLSNYAVLFRFWRGSTRIKIVDPGSNTMLTTQMIPNTLAYNSYPVALMPTPPVGQADQPTVTIPSLSGGGEYEIPYYSMTHASHVTVNSSASTAFPARELIDNQSLLQVTQQSNFSTSTRVYRAAGDDYSLGFFIGTIPLTTATMLA